MKMRMLFPCMGPPGAKEARWALILFLLALAACSNSSSPPPLTLEELPSVVQKAFTKTKPELKVLADEVISAVQSNGYAKAYANLQNLSVAPGLTKNQSSVVGRAMITVGGLLQSAAAKGDEQATEAVQIYRSQK